MPFSNEWEQRYFENTHISIWPWSDLVSYVRRYTKQENPNYNVLELGCGAGANIPFFLSLKVNYHGMDGSPTIVEKLKQRFPQLKENLLVGDFTVDIPFNKKFDLIVDRAAITCNSTQEIKNCINMIYEKLSSNGVFIGTDWYSTSHYEYFNGKSTNDEFTRKDYDKGTFAGTGLVHFSSKAHIEELFNKFRILVMEHKIIKNVMADVDTNFASWNFVAQKKN